MSKYKANEEGIAALRDMSSKLEDARDGIEKSTNTIRNTSESYNETLGPHKASLDEVLESILYELKKSGESIETVQETLEDIADGYQDIVDNDPFKRSGN